LPPILVLLLALIGISASGPLVRSSHADPLAIAVWRLGLSLVVVAIALALTGSWRELRRLRAREVAIAAGAGVMLALHFWSWNASVHMTSVSASVVLVNMHPPVVALLSAVWLGERPGRRQWLGIVIAMLGAIVVATGDANAGATVDHRRALLGDMLALVGAVTVAVYFVSGRRLRTTLSLWPYVALVYGAAFVTLTAISIGRGVPLVGYQPRELWIFAGLAVGPMLLGHTGMNYALRFFPAYVVNLTVLGEPIGATLLAMVIPWIREMPTTSTLVGGAVTLSGVLLAAWRTSATSDT
jgi:drug/metabolite transporter (DMT)-like permease